MKDLCIDLYCGLGGWADGFLAEGYEVIGFDIEPHDYGTGGYPAQLVLQDVLTLHGGQFRDAAVIVASPPCQAYSYRAMPWKRAKALPPPDNTLFDACFRIQREACDAAGRYIPLVVENVKGAQPWVGRAAWHYGSYYLWGDVPALMPFTSQLKRPGRNFHAFENGLGSSPSFNGHEGETRGVKDATKNGGGSWFAVAHNTGSGHSRNAREQAMSKMQAAGAGLEYGGDFGWDGSAMRTGNSKSSARKAASAQIAKIPFALAQHIAQVYRLPVVRKPATGTEMEGFEKEVRSAT